MLPHLWGKTFTVRNLYFSLLVANVPTCGHALKQGIGGGISPTPRQTRQKPHTATFPGLLGISPLVEILLPVNEISSHFGGNTVPL